MVSARRARLASRPSWRSLKILVRRDVDGALSRDFRSPGRPASSIPLPDGAAVFPARSFCATRSAAAEYGSQPARREKFFHGMFLLYVISIFTQKGTCVKSGKGAILGHTICLREFAGLSSLHPCPSACCGVDRTAAAASPDAGSDPCARGPALLGGAGHLRQHGSGQSSFCTRAAHLCQNGKHFGKFSSRRSLGRRERRSTRAAVNNPVTPTHFLPSIPALTRSCAGGL